MKIIVTGASGFLGGHLSDVLEQKGHEVIRLNSKNCDLTCKESLFQFNNIQYDYIYHLAAWTQAGDFCLYHSGEQWLINQQINVNVLSWWQKFQPQSKLISIGTSCAYEPYMEMVEENYLIGLPIESLFSYAMTKRMLYVGLLALRKQFGLNYLYIVPSTLYGPRYHTDGRQMHFIFDLIRKILRGQLYDEKVTLWGDGNQLRELIHIDDFINVMLSLNENIQNDIVNIGSGEEFTIRYFAHLICDCVGYPFEKIYFDVNAYIGAKSKCLNINKLKGYLPDLQFKPLNIGIQETINWFLQNRERLLPE